MPKSSTVEQLRQAESNPWRESLEQRLREQMRELIRLVARLEESYQR